MTDWNINPLLLMKEELTTELFGRFKPDTPNDSYKNTGSQNNFFYKTDKWRKWTTPLDQPMIKLAAPVAGPRSPEITKEDDI